MPDRRPDETYFPRRLILAGALIAGMLLGLAVHMLSQTIGLDVAGLWRADAATATPTSAAVAWWLISTASFVGGFTTASLLNSAVSGQLPRPLRYFLVGVLIVTLAAAGQAASGPSGIPTIAGVLSGFAALIIGAVMAFCGAHFALRRA